MASREFLKIMKSARLGDVLAQQKIGQIYMLGEAGTPKNIPNALLWLEKTSVTIGFSSDIFNFVADHLDLSVALTSSQASFAWKCLSLAANGGHTHARWLIAQSVSQVRSSSNISEMNSSVIAFSQLTEKDWIDLGGFEPFKKLAHRYLEELADLSSFKEQTSAKKLLALCLADGRLGTLDVERSQKIVASLASQSNDLGLTSLLSVSSLTANEFNQSLIPALQLHLPTLLSNKKHSLKHLPIYWAGWQQLQNVEALEIAAELGHVPAQLALGLRLAKLDVLANLVGDDSNVVDNATHSGNARLKRAVYWLKQAANQGERDAWYALGLINRMPQYS
ncbi:MAG: hypothetical protein RIQ84_1696, partial [Pseudomonadota bacterium]